MSTQARPDFSKIRPSVYVCHNEDGYKLAMADFWKREPDEDERPITPPTSYPCVTFFWLHYMGRDVINCTSIPVDVMWASLQVVRSTTK